MCGARAPAGDGDVTGERPSGIQLACDGLSWHRHHMTDPAYLDAAEVAARLGISLRTVRRRIADGSLPSLRIGRAVADLPPL
jgi:excisionase family DNA binding protein